MNVRIKQMKMTIAPQKKAKSRTGTIRQAGFRTPYCSHNHRSQLEAIECARHTRLKLSRMRGGI
jgi:hypothetical protein